MKGTEVDSKTNEIESFAKSIANKYETTKSNENIKTDEKTNADEATDTDDIPNFISYGFNLRFIKQILFLFIFIL